jgi:hypothetical protein
MDETRATRAGAQQPQQRRETKAMLSADDFVDHLIAARMNVHKKHRLKRAASDNFGEAHPFRRQLGRVSSTACVAACSGAHGDTVGGV